MNKEETIKNIQDIINANCWTISEQFAKNVATALYNAGYGKIEDQLEEYSRKNTILAAENAKLSLKLRQVLLSIDTVKEMNDMCNIDEQRKQAVHDFIHPILLSLQCRIDDNYDSPEYEEVYRLVKEYLEDELKEFDNE